VIEAPTAGRTRAGRTPAGRAPAGLYRLKPWYTARLSAVLRHAADRSWSPDAFTAVGMLAALGAAGAVWATVRHPLAGLAVLPLLAARLAGANLDGALARARGVSRPWGAVLNELGDRGSDLVVMLALAAQVGWGWALVATVSASLPTFASLAVAAAGGSRANGGPLGKTERAALLSLAGIAAAFGWQPWFAVTVLVLVGSPVTAALRLRAGHRELSGTAA
jgi:CDP-diacylglycerol--glycerol-3-phosphate 3-phosphatidyltransferase